MADKTLTFEGNDRVFADPDLLAFGNGYLETVYRFFFELLVEGPYAPQFDVDDIIAGQIAVDLPAIGAANGIVVALPNAGGPNPARAAIQHYLRYFLDYFPEFYGLFNNALTSAKISIANAAFLLGAPCSGANFIRVKEIIDMVNDASWTRNKDGSERQSGVSVLGEISEQLLASALSGLIDNEKFFKVGGSDVKSYGDFVAMCLPNNLWISVKSNYARERLLASGYSNDIVGAGFFVDHTEFSNPTRIRNFQRAGFLAMYCPDAPVTPAQRAADSSTYAMILEHYQNNGITRPLNINGNPFIRPLSELPVDVQNLLAEADIKRRLTVRF